MTDHITTTVVEDGPDTNALETDLWMVRYDTQEFWVDAPENDAVIDVRGRVLNAVAEHTGADEGHVNRNARVTEPVEGF